MPRPQKHSCQQQSYTRRRGSWMHAPQPEAALPPPFLSPVDPHHPVLAGEHLLEVLEADVKVADQRAAHAVHAALAELALGRLGEAAGAGRVVGRAQRAGPCLPCCPHFTPFLLPHSAPLIVCLVSRFPYSLFLWKHNGPPKWTARASKSATSNQAGRPAPLCPLAEAAPPAPRRATHS